MAIAIMLTQPAQALDPFVFETPGASDDLRDILRAASLTREASRAETVEAQDVFASARADYARLLGALYDQGYYSGRISIRINDREVAAIAPMDAPESVRSVSIRVEPGPRFRFAQAAIAPLAPKTQLPPGYRVGEVAHSGVIVEAATAGVDGWRDQGHAKAEVAGQQITADHRAHSLAADIRLSPGPQLRFGTLKLSGYDRLRPRRLAKIAGIPTGEVFSPDKMDEVRSRLRRTGIFSAVTLTEAETIGPGNTLDAELLVVEEKPRRFGFGAEVASLDGLSVNGYWLHRNLLGGGERFRADVAVEGIGGTTGGTDYSIGARIDRPATLTPDTSAFIETQISRLSEEDYDEDSASLGIGFTHIFSENLTGELGLSYAWSRVTDASGEQIFRRVSLPTRLTWDKRDLPADATSGYFVDATVTPFKGFGETGSGAQVKGDLRGYYAIGGNDRFVLAGRAQIGAVFGSRLGETPRDFLFYSGGGGTVRGQPYQSLGVSVLRGGTLHTGGTKFLGLSGEIRAGVTEKIGVVAFYDSGFIGASSFSGSDGEWHAGAGLGLRYKTGIGPIRLDLAGPVSGSTGDGVQLYLGIGQAF